MQIIHFLEHLGSLHQPKSGLYQISDLQIEVHLKNAKL
jgi:hypothetical protein